MDKLQINIPIKENGEIFWVSGAWGEDGDVITTVSMACNLDCEHLWDTDCLNCKYRDVDMEEKLVKKYDGNMYVAMKVLKDIFEVE